MTVTPDLNGRIALVTGASRGIGAAIATALARAGAAVAVNYRERADAADAVVADIKSTGRRGIAVAADVSQAAAVAKMVDHVASALGPIDILINNAGMAIVRGIDDLTESDFDQTIAVNLKSAFLCTQAVVPAMRAKKWGRIVNISSGAGAFVGSNSSLLAPVKIGNGAYVGSGSVITRNVPDDALAVERSEQINREGGAARYRELKTRDKPPKGG
jgi:3-oxoacyl-[acyl-carrier protein] reductase